MAASSLPRALDRTVVLVIDRDHETQATYGYALSALGFDVMMAANADEAHARAVVRRPDIILASVAVNGGHDWTLLARISADPKTDDVPVVAVTADATPAVCERAERAGCTALCLKSCPPTELARGLRAVLDRGATHRDPQQRRR